MQTKLIAAAVALVAAACTFAAEPSKPTLSPEAKAMMEACEAAAQPGPMHQKLEPFVGEWSTTMTCWMPGTPEPVTTAGTSTVAWTHGNRYLHETSNMTCPLKGTPMAGTGYFGYDNAAKCFTGVWLGDGMTGIMPYKGDLSSDGKTFTLTGTEMDPMSGQPMTFKIVHTVPSADKHTMTMYYVMPQGEMKAFEIAYTRKA